MNETRTELSQNSQRTIRNRPTSQCVPGILISSVSRRPTVSHRNPQIAGIWTALRRGLSSLIPSAPIALASAFFGYGRASRNIAVFEITFVFLVLFSTPARADHPSEFERAERVRKQQLVKEELRLKKMYGEFDSYVFTVLVIRPELSHTFTQTANGYSQRSHATVTFHQRVETETIKVKGHDEAAKFIWQASRNAIRYSYRVIPEKPAKPNELARLP